MKDQGKISGVNQSSHRYQSSNTVGWIPDSPRVGLQRTRGRNLRRFRSKRRKLVKAAASLPPNASPEQVQWALYPEKMERLRARDFHKRQKAHRHQAYLDFMSRYGRVYRPKTFTKEDHESFVKFYDDPSRYPEMAMFEEITLRYNQWLCTCAGPKPAISLAQFPRADIPPKYVPSLLYGGHRSCRSDVPPQLRMPGYQPSSLVYTPQSGVLEACDSVSEMLDELVDSSTFAQLSDLCTFRRPLLSVVVLSLVVLAVQVFRYTVLTVNFLSGLLLGVLFGKPKLKYQYVPQAAPLSSDDGLAFTGKKVASTSMPASANAPGMSVSPTTGWGQTTPNSAQPRVSPPKQSRKDPYDGPLNGFGIGI